MLGFASVTLHTKVAVSSSLTLYGFPGLDIISGTSVSKSCHCRYIKICLKTFLNAFTILKKISTNGLLKNAFLNNAC